MTWDRSDHPLELPNIGNYALIVNPLVHHYELTKCLMDGGSSINIMYIATLLKLGLNETQLRHRDIEFMVWCQGGMLYPWDPLRWKSLLVTRKISAKSP